MKIKARLFILCVLLFEILVINWVHFRIENRVLDNRKQKEQALQIEKMITEDIKCFPVPLQEKGNVSFQNDYGANRENGEHEGCDIMYTENVAGLVPIVSVTKGQITNLGWLYLGGYRVGITSDNGVYYYYAHLDSYAPGLFVGKEINAGEFLGFMGNTGEGKEGAKGKFPVHLHFAIYIFDESGNEQCVNPYPYLLKINMD